MKKSLLN
ncbi:hypothetical protein F383_15030 [Gossypium arboreum]|nr:hypothetical protein F383_15030 [Gossypium arboreum]